LARGENLLQGSFLIEELTDLVEEAVLAEFERLDQQGGVLGAMELQYQRSRIQEESRRYERRKDSGELPIVGVNAFLKDGEEPLPERLPLARATPQEKRQRIAAVRAFQRRHQEEAPAALAQLRQVALSGGNTFAALLECVRVASLGQITRALRAVGGQYRRAM